LAEVYVANSVFSDVIRAAEVFNMVGAIAQFEREIMLQRQREGIAKAKAAGKSKGRAPTAMAKADEVLTLLKGGTGTTEVAQQLKIGRASV
jgi:DNA invertase Pin-like site-specific DNA recombinase